MNDSMMLSLLAIFLVLPALTGFVWCLVSYRQCRVELQNHQELVKELEQYLEQYKQDLEKTSFKVSDYGRRLAWLETRYQRTKRFSNDVIEKDPEIIEPKPIAEPIKTTMTERRHRVLSLAQLGQNAETIAETLGMLTGEVELILHLNTGRWSVVSDQ
jgi:hypothetical protein